MLNYFLKSEKAQKILNSVSSGKSFGISGLTQMSKLIFARMISEKKKVCLIVENEQIALKYKNDFNVLFGEKNEILPFSNIGIYDFLPPDIYVYSSQISVLKNLENIDILIVPVKSLFEKFPDREFIEANTLSFTKETETVTDNLAQKLIERGFKKAVTVTDAGEFAIRGDTTDIFSIDENPLRIEFWGDTITDLRYFNPENQRSIEKVNSAKILPVSKFLRDKKTDEILKQNVKKSFEHEISKFEEEDKKFLKEKLEEFCANIDEGVDFEGKEYFSHLANPDLKTITELLPKDYVVVFDEYEIIKTKYEFRDKRLLTDYEKNLKLPGTLPLYPLAHDNLKTFLSTLTDKTKIYLDNFVNNDTFNLTEFDTSAAPTFSADTEKIFDFLSEYRKNGYKIFIGTNYETRVKELLKECELPEGKNEAVTVIKNLSMPGCIIRDFKIVILTDRELFNKKSETITATPKRHKREKVTILTPGDYVVHEIHGIGLYKGISGIEIDGETKDYLTIEYFGGDKLYLPAEQINLISIYTGAGGIKPQLSKMGGNDWNNIKTKTKKSVEEVALKLLALYSKRKAEKGYAFDPDTPWQYEMEESFPYTETPDQMKAIIETKADMELEKPMERLICGDVGFGKTEVALRAAFKAVMSGKQVAFIAPTTVLALQHYNVIQERLSPFSVKTEMFSRFKTRKEIKEGLEKLANGEIDIATGTHRLFQDDVFFKDLGLLIIDEEHKFGVKDKEKLKMLKKSTDVLSMSATPIPRTLYMSLSGIRDMSVISTPPAERLPVKTYVEEYNEKTVINAINYELERDGQVFYVYNRVETINDFAAQLQKLVPNAKIAVAHGKTPPLELEKIMFEFRGGKYDILLCTAIIESGVDIKNANTMIIHDADRFGLAQLYQLRGRVGRSDRLAYCHCLYKKGKNISEDAYKRLEAVKEFSSFGSGYQIALKDIEIRGIGNLLGTKQHGKMAAVGFETYCSLLDEAVKELQNIKTTKLKTSTVDINVTAYIPDSMVGTTEQKILEYKRLSEVKSIAEADAVRAEWIDRFSKSEEPVENLIKLVKLRIAATDAGILSVRETGSGIRIYTDFSMPELKIIKSKLKPEIARKLQTVTLPKDSKEGKSVMILSSKLMNFDEVFNILTDLFYYIFKIISEYKI